MATAWCFSSRGSVSEGSRKDSLCFRRQYFPLVGKENEPVQVNAPLKRGPISLRGNRRTWRNEMLTVVSGNSAHQAKRIGPLIEK